MEQPHPAHMQTCEVAGKGIDYGRPIASFNVRSLTNVQINSSSFCKKQTGLENSQQSFEVSALAEICIQILLIHPMWRLSGSVKQLLLLVFGGLCAVTAVLV